MICNIAGLGVKIPELGDLKERCKEYIADVSPDIEINAKKMDPGRFKEFTEDQNYYMQAGFVFYRKLLDFGGLMLHASAVLLDGRVYLFSGQCGVGKSTHAEKYLDKFKNAVIINDDKPALRKIDGEWLCFGTPFCGKDGINKNLYGKVAGICFLKRGDTKIEPLGGVEAVSEFLSQTISKLNASNTAVLVNLVADVVTSVPVFRFYNHANESDEMITYNAINNALKEGNI